MNTTNAVELVRRIRELAEQGNSRQEASYEAVIACVKDVLAMPLNERLMALLRQLQERVRMLHRTRHTFPESSLMRLLEDHLVPIERFLSGSPAG